MRVAAELDVEARAWGGGEVVCHHGRGASIEGEGRNEHPAVADRDELGNAPFVVGIEQRERVAAGGRLE